MKNARRKKPNRFNSQEAAQYKNIFKQKVLEIARAVSPENPTGLLNNELLEKIFFTGAGR